MQIIGLILQLILLVLAIILLWYEINLVRSFRAGAPLISTPSKEVAHIVSMAHIKPGEKVYELGSGDGRISIAAAQASANVVGIDVNAYAIWISRFKAKRLGLKKLKFIKKNIKDCNFADADVIFIYMLPAMMKWLEPKLTKELQPGSRIIAKSFPFPSLKPDKVENGIYKYIMKR